MFSLPVPAAADPGQGLIGSRTSLSSGSQISLPSRSPRPASSQLPALPSCLHSHLPKTPHSHFPFQVPSYITPRPGFPGLLNLEPSYLPDSFPNPSLALDVLCFPPSSPPQAPQHPGLHDTHPVGLATPRFSQSSRPGALLQPAPTDLCLPGTWLTAPPRASSSCQLTLQCDRCTQIDLEGSTGFRAGRNLGPWSYQDSREAKRPAPQSQPASCSWSWDWNPDSQTWTAPHWIKYCFLNRAFLWCLDMKPRRQKAVVISDEKIADCSKSRLLSLIGGDPDSVGTG